LELAKLSRYDAVLVLTDHSSLDYAEIVRQSNLVIDTRNVTKKVSRNNEKVLKA
jgi:UDP-N-acetyl-D-glucosamine dehydrogenase